MMRSEKQATAINPPFKIKSVNQSLFSPPFPFLFTSSVREQCMWMVHR
uniref:Uncharacterized protein n=1 Tax=Aegilops tauschii subsp. strangulata TaxID=200361 RepID=A0A453AXB3_AEGTS